MRTNFFHAKQIRKILQQPKKIRAISHQTYYRCKKRMFTLDCPVADP